MYFNRPEAKMRAKASLRATSPHPVLVTLIFALLTTLLTNIISSLVSSPFQVAYLYLLEGNYAPEQVFSTIFTPDRVTLYLVLSILIALYTCVMNFGYSSYALRMARYERPGFRNLFDGFAALGRVIGINILIGIFTFLWSLLAMVPYIVLMILGAVFSAVGAETAGVVLLVLAIVLMIVGIIFAISVTYRYRLAFYFLLDHPKDMGMLECIRQSKLTMKGRKRTLFVLDLSFLGWEILSLLTFGILGLWVKPYRTATEANFYNWAVYGAFPEPPAPPVNDTSPNF